MDGLRLVEFSEMHLPAIATIVDDEWHFTVYGGNPIQTASDYILSYVRNYDFTRVALVGDRPVGIIVASSGDRHAVKSFDLSEKYAGTPFLIDMQLFDDADARLRSEHDLNGLGELNLIIVSKEFKNKGIGKALLHEAEEFMMAEGCDGVFISTDDECDFGFYKSMGAELLGKLSFVSRSKTIVRMLYRLGL